jgi:N-acetylglucosaminyldiphosphoundecaprenol N-acetyl-beta-D-mannosaminyltransferase
LRKINVLGVDLYNGDIPLFCKEEILPLENKSANKCVSFTGAHGIIHAKKHDEFSELLNSFYLNLPDGMPGVWVAKLKGAKKINRSPGPEAFKQVMIETSNTTIKHFFCGGKDGVAEKLKNACEKNFNNHNIVGVLTPPFKEVDEFDYKAIGEEINKTNADIVWVGISTPKQEFFANNLSKFTNVEFLITVGAAFDFHTGSIKYAPKWMQNMGLEWLFRLISEPKRLWRRYFEVVPKFIAYSFKELIFNKEQ